MTVGARLSISLQPLWFDNRLALRGLSDEKFAILAEGDNGRRRPPALGVLDHLGSLALHHGDAGVCRAKIDADCLCCHG